MFEKIKETINAFKKEQPKRQSESACYVCEGGARQWTEDEIRQMLINHIWSMIHYWEKESGSVQNRLSGFAHSMLAMIDGCAVGLPKFILAPDPHPDDKAFMFGEGENWFPENNAEIECDISGGLHEILYKGKQT